MNRISKQTLASMVASGFALETYEHRYQGTVRIYNVTAMRAMAKSSGLPVLHVDIQDIVPHLKQNSDWDQERVDSMPASSWKEDPCIAVVETDAARGEVHTFIDGIHRAFRREKEGLDTVLLYVFPIEHAILISEQQYRQLEGPFAWGDKDFVGDQLLPRKGA